MVALLLAARTRFSDAMTRGYTIAELASIVGGTLRGDGSAVISGVADVAEAGSTDAAWVYQPKYAAKLGSSHAGVVLVSKDHGPTPMPAILCERVDRAVAKLLAAFAPADPEPEPGIHPSAVVHPSATVASSTTVGPFVVIDAGATIGGQCVLHSGVFIGRETTVGNDCVICPNAVVRERCRLGDRVTLHAGAVIGTDGFGYYFDDGRHNRIPHIGGVILEDDVEIGACACVDRAKFGNTIVGRGTKIDNLVQIAHNVRLGEHNVLAGLTGIAGSVRTGPYCMFGGRSGCTDNLTLGEGVRLTALGTVVTKNMPPGVMLSGAPARQHRDELREQAAIRRLPGFAAQLKDLLARVERLETSTHHRS